MCDYLFYMSRTARPVKVTLPTGGTHSGEWRRVSRELFGSGALRMQLAANVCTECVFLATGRIRRKSIDFDR